MKKAQRIAMKAVIFNDEGKVLILRDAGDSYAQGTVAGKYHLPGGRIDIGEHWQHGLLREVEEESGLVVTHVRPVCIDEWSPTIKGVETQIIAVFHLCKIVSGEVRLSEEHDNYEWASEGQIDTFNLTESYRAACYAGFADKRR